MTGLFDGDCSAEQSVHFTAWVGRRRGGRCCPASSFFQRGSCGEGGKCLPSFRAELHMGGENPHIHTPCCRLQLAHSLEPANCHGALRGRLWDTRACLWDCAVFGWIVCCLQDGDGAPGTLCSPEREKRVVSTPPR